jgi:hypothetical protein
MNADVQSGMEETWLDFLSPSTTIKSGQTVKTRAGLVSENPTSSLVPIVNGLSIGGAWRPRLAGYEGEKTIGSALDVSS